MPWYIILISVLGIVILVETFLLIRLSITIFKFEDEITGCLDKIDVSYKKIATILEKPLFYDSPEVREVLNQIGSVNNSLLEIANGLASVDIEGSTEGD
jgi:hypothetical protein